MTLSLVTPILLGLDSLVICLALGPLKLEIRQATTLAGLFGLCDGLGLLAGGAFHPFFLASGMVIPALMGLWTALVLLLMIRGTPAVLPLLPVLLACDNFVTAAEAGRAVLLEDAAVSCAVSAALAAIGLLVGRTFASHVDLPPGRARLTGTGLLLAAGFVAIAA